MRSIMNWHNLPECTIRRRWGPLGTRQSPWRWRLESMRAAHASPFYRQCKRSLEMKTHSEVHTVRWILVWFSVLSFENALTFDFLSLLLTMSEYLPLLILPHIWVMHPRSKYHHMSHGLDMHRTHGNWRVHTGGRSYVICNSVYFVRCPWRCFRHPLISREVERKMELLNVWASSWDRSKDSYDLDTLS